MVYVSAIGSDLVSSRGRSGVMWLLRHSARCNCHGLSVCLQETPSNEKIGMIMSPRHSAQTPFWKEGGARDLKS
jgi:hypothetical protein